MSGDKADEIAEVAIDAAKAEADNELAQAASINVNTSATAVAAADAAAALARTESAAAVQRTAEELREKEEDIAWLKQQTKANSDTIQTVAANQQTLQTEMAAQTNSIMEALKSLTPKQSMLEEPENPPQNPEKESEKEEGRKAADNQEIKNKPPARKVLWI